MTFNLRISNGILAAKFYLSQIPARMTVTGVGMAVGCQIATSALAALENRGRKPRSNRSAERPMNDGSEQSLAHSGDDRKLETE